LDAVLGVIRAVIPALELRVRPCGRVFSPDILLLGCSAVRTGFTPAIPLTIVDIVIHDCPPPTLSATTPNLPYSLVETICDLIG
jgi:hypothetical protein